MNIRELSATKFEKVIYDPAEQDPSFNKEAINNKDIDSDQQSKNYVTAKNLNDLKNVVNGLTDTVSSITLYLSNIEETMDNSSSNSTFKGYNIINYTPSNGITEVSGNLFINLSNFLQKNQILIDNQSFTDSIKNLDDYYLKLKNVSVDGNKVKSISSYNLVSYSSVENYITSSTILAMDYLTSYIKENVATQPEITLSAGTGISINNNKININLADNGGLKFNDNNQLMIDNISGNSYYAGDGLDLNDNQFSINLAENRGLKFNTNNQLMIDQNYITELINQNQNVVSVVSYGLNGDGSYDNAEAMANLINDINNKNIRDIYFPAGTYLFSTSANASNWDNFILFSDISNLRIHGAGDASILKYKNTNTKTSQHSLLKLVNVKNIKFENIKFEGDLFNIPDPFSSISSFYQETEIWPAKEDLNNNLTNPNRTDYWPDQAAWYSTTDKVGHLITGGNVKNITFNNVTFANARFMAINLTGSENVQVANCRFYNILRDGIHLKHSHNAIITNNHFYRVCDDAIALHTAYGDILNYWGEIRDHKFNTTVGHSHIISNNNFDASQGIKILGAKNILITNNIFRRSIGHAIYLSNKLEDEITKTNMFNITVDNNIMLDTLNHIIHPNGHVLYIQNAATPELLNNNPKSYNWEKLINNNGTAVYTNNASPANNIKITNNTIGRTIDYTSGYYSDVYGDYLLNLGYPNSLNFLPFSTAQFYDINFENSNTPGVELFNCEGVYLKGSFKNLTIDNNNFFGFNGKSVILYDNKYSEHNILQDFYITNNKFEDCILTNYTSTSSDEWQKILDLSGNATSIIYIKDIATDNYIIKNQHIPSNYLLSGNIHINNNLFNLDPYCRDSLHNNTNNTWDYIIKATYDGQQYYSFNTTAIRTRTPSIVYNNQNQHLFLEIKNNMFKNLICISYDNFINLNKAKISENIAYTSTADRTGIGHRKIITQHSNFNWITVNSETSKLIN